MARKSGVFAFFDIAPLLLIPVLIYNIAAGLGAIGGADAFVKSIEEGRFDVPLPSDMTWWIAGGDFLVLLALCLLFAELLRSATDSPYAVANHALSLLLFVGCLLQFLLLPAFATSTYFLITVMTFLDVMAGVVVLIASARRTAPMREDEG
jgi:hypothetical protein